MEFISFVGELSKKDKRPEKQEKFLIFLV